MGLILAPISVVVLLLGESRILQAQVDGWDASTEVLGIVLVSLGLLLLGCVLLLALWTPAVPITGGTLLTLAGIVYLYAAVDRPRADAQRPHVVGLAPHGHAGDRRGDVGDGPRGRFPAPAGAASWRGGPSPRGPARGVPRAPPRVIASAGAWGGRVSG